MLKLDKSQRTADVTSHKNGVFVSLEPINHFGSSEYLKLAKKTIEHAQNHPNQVPDKISSRLRLFYSPATAVIVGTGTVGLEAIVYASRILPLDSTILIFQNDVKEPDILIRLLDETIKGIENFKIIISPPIDIGCIDKIAEFLMDNQGILSNTQLFMHTADKAQRYIPDNLDYREVVAQIIRRSSIQAIEELIERHADPNSPYVRILFS